MRHLFAMILIFCDPASPADLWTTFQQKLSEDFLHGHVTMEQSINLALLDIKELLQVHKKKPTDFGLPDPMETITQQQDGMWNAEDQSIKSAGMIRQLNADQKAAFDAIMSAVDFLDNTEANLFFIDGPGGSGKTFLYNALLSQIRGRNQVAIAVASSGIAAELLDGGRTAHSTFKIPIPIEDHSTCCISRQSKLAQRIMEAAIIIWDEAPMMDRRVFECVSRTIIDITGDARPFGGKVVILGGDFRQILPVVRRGGEADIINASLHKSHLWRRIKLLPLRRNMRANSDDALQFDAWLRRIGDGTEATIPELGETTVRMPAHLCLPPGNVDTLITAVFPQLAANHSTHEYLKYLSERAILTTTNEYVDAINKQVLSRIPSPEKVYYSADSVGDPDQSALYPTEFLNSINISGIAAHILCLKQGTPVMLLRNLDPKAGLLNGTRLVITHLGERVIEARILTGQKRGTSVFIPRITLTPSDSGLPFDLKRRQFPLRPSYAITINKAQGQTLASVGIFLPVPVFTHGQLYVALSRARGFSSIQLMLQDRTDTKEEPFFTHNIVYKPVLQAL